MPNEQTAQEEFLKDITPENAPNPLDEFSTPPQATTPPEAGKEQTEGDKEPPKNRRERRLREQLDAERESSTFLAGKLQGLTEAQKLREETEPSEYLKKVEKIYGTQSPEAVEATKLLQEAIRGAEEQAVERALEMFREEQRSAVQAVEVEEKNLDSMVDSIEDEFDVDIDEPTEQRFFQLLEKMSPKDEEGNITAYADHFSVWEQLQSQKQQSAQPQRAKNLASRSMVRTGSSPNTTAGADANERWLLENGII